MAGCRWCGLYLKATPANPRGGAPQVGSARHLPIDKMDAEAGQPCPNVGGAHSHTYPTTPPHAVFLRFGHNWYSTLLIDTDKMDAEI